MNTHRNAITHQIIGASIDVHRSIGPGQDEIPLSHSAVLDLTVANQVLVAIRVSPNLLPVHEAQVRSHMRLGNLPSAVLLNFHARRLTEELRRFGEEKIPIS